MGDEITFEYRNPVLVEEGVIDCEINHPVHGWIPFTVSLGDEEAVGAALYRRIVESEDELEVYLEPLADISVRKRRAIATALADALAAGMPYTMPDGREDTVQVLAEDRQNLLGLAIEARDLKAAGETGAVQEFRAKSNTRYPMTPDQTIALTDVALGHYKLLKAQSWDRKDAIDAALKAEDRDALEAIDWGN